MQAVPSPCDYGVEIIKSVSVAMGTGVGAKRDE